MGPDCMVPQTKNRKLSNHSFFCSTFYYILRARKSKMKLGFSLHLFKDKLVYVGISSDFVLFCLNKLLLPLLCDKVTVL